MKLDVGAYGQTPPFAREIEWVGGVVTPTIQNDVGTARGTRQIPANVRGFLAALSAAFIVTTAGGAGEYLRAVLEITISGTPTFYGGVGFLDGTVVGNTLTLQFNDGFPLNVGDFATVRTLTNPTAAATGIYTGVIGSAIYHFEV